MKPEIGKECKAIDAKELTFSAYPNRAANLGELHISRALPIRDRRMVGPWCFLDRFGPLTFSGDRPMNVPPHPHIGIQTVSWLLEGEVLHNDSLGCEALARPGTVNVMTAGSGISHAEETPGVNSGRLNGVQLWVALPEAFRNIEPAFQHVAQVPDVEVPGAIIKVFAGSIGGASSPASYFSEIIGLDVQVHAGEAVELAVNSGFEHALLVLGGECRFEGQPLEEKMLYYLGGGRSSLALTSQAGGRVLVIGGPPFPETILMWWNFVARTPEEISQARADWEAGLRFGVVRGEHWPRLAAPALVRFARPHPLS